jgi:hypothetical protein
LLFDQDGDASILEIHFLLPDSSEGY